MDLLKRVHMPKRDAALRSKCFSEVALGYTPEDAALEASRCIFCRNRPCTKGCPVNIKIPEFINFIADGEFEKAYLKIAEDSSLPAICGRVCPQEDQCEKYCIRGIKGEPLSIGALERFAADWYRDNRKPFTLDIVKNHIKTAVVGGGPAGLTAAGDLARYGFEVTVFEALHKSGGVLGYGIPEFRLPKELVQSEIENISRLGVEFKHNVLVGRSVTVDDLFEDGYKAVFIGSGAGLPSFLGIKGENLNGVYSANEYLTRVNLMKAYDEAFPTPVKKGGKVAVVGGGNVAMDAARTALRLGAENVKIVYRRSRNELPARMEEIENAIEEGVEMLYLTAPTEVLGDGDRVTGLKSIKMELGEPDSSGRRRPVPMPGSEFVLPLDTLIVAIGQSPNPLISSLTPGLKIEKWGGIITNPSTGETSRKGVYAGGDAVTGAATVILAMGMGKTAARAIKEFLAV
jgi:glutamate synthase (NADPH/NADH) small chain